MRSDCPRIRSACHSSSMSLSHCVNCGSDIEGSVDGIPLTICCQKCATSEKNSEGERTIYGGYYCISKTRALRKYRGDAKQLGLLQFVTKDDTSEEKGSPMKMFVRAEVVKVNKLTPVQKKEVVDQRQRALVDEKNRIEKQFDFNLCTMDISVRHLLLGDYLSGDDEPKTTLEEVESRCAVVGRVQEIMKANERPHPEDVFRFFLENPDADVREFWDFRDKMRKVFQLESFRILHKLPMEDQDQLETTALQDVHKEFSERDVKGLIHGHLLKGTDRKTATEIMLYPACQRRIETGGEEAAVATKLLQFWNEKDDRARRMQRLTTTLAARRLALPRGYEIAELYLSGEMDCDEDEIAGVLELQGKLGLYKTAKENRRLLFQQRLHKSLKLQLHQKKLSYAEAVNEVMQQYWLESASEDDFDTYSDDWSAPYDSSVDLIEEPWYLDDFGEPELFDGHWW